MILYFANRTMDILGRATTYLKNGFVITEDKKTEDVETGIATFEGKIGFKKATRKRCEEMTAAGNYILCKNGENTEFYTILDREIDTKSLEIYVYAEDAGLDLINEIAPEYEATEAHTAEWYINKYIIDSGFEIGINEIPASSTRTLKWDGESTVTERLASIATQFGGYEISFSFDIKGMEIANKYVNIYKERGKNTEETLRLNKDIDRIVTTETIANLATALRVTGGTPEDSDTPITLKGYTYDDGDFYVGSDGVLRSREAVAKWSRYVWNKEPNKLDGYNGHITRTYSYDTTSQSTLCAHAVTELKKLCEPAINYEVDISKLPENVKIGDRVNIIDEAGELFLSSRILKLETSETENIYTVTFGEHLIKDGGISSKVEEMAAKFAYIANSAEKAKALADNAQAVADEAKTTADSALSEASNAQQSANEANTAADNAQLAAETAQSKADEAAEAAQNAQNDADVAKKAAEKAQSTADTAVTNAAAAQTIADTAVTNAAAAQTTANAAKQDAVAAQADIDSLGESLETLSNTMIADYARKTDLTEATASLQTQITQNADSITSTALKVQTIDETANNAQSLAKAAQSAAEEAQITADAATADAAKAQQAADDAALAAINAQNEADAAQTAAATAQSVADKAEADLEAAKADLATVQSRVDATEEDIAAAEEAVNAAQTAADIAKADAAIAQSTADTAKTNAATAQEAANNAKTAADAAQAAADTAQAAADAAQRDVDALAVRVTTAETNITQTSEQIALMATKTEVAEALGGYYTKTQTDAAITTKANEITSAVSATYATKTALGEANESITSLETRVTQTESSITSQAASISSQGTRISTLEQNAEGFTVRLNTVEADAIVSTVEQFYLSSSATALSGGSWSNSQPTWTNGKYIWRRTLVTYGDGSTAYTPSSTGVCITGNTGAQGETGETGERGAGIYKITTAPSSYTTATCGFTPTYRIALSTALSQTGASEILIGDNLRYSYYLYPVGYVDSSYVYLGARTSIRGATGAAGADGANGADGADGQMLYATCSTAAGTAAKVATLASGTLTLKAGATVSVKFTYANNVSSPTLNVASTGAKSIRLNGAALTSSAYYWVAGAVVTFVYDGSYWNISDAAALSKANSAQSTADSAASAASTAQTVADTANSTANTANTNATAAQATADTAKANAAAAQSTANSASTAAANAQSTADTANSTANTAKTNAAAAQSTANTARTEAANAAKTATNYLSFSSSGLVVGDMTASTLGNNVLIDSDSVDIRKGTTVLASYSANKIQLGMNSISSIVELCGGMGQVEYDGDKDYLELTSDRVRVRGDSTAAIYVLGSDNVSRTGVTAKSNAICMYATVDSEIEPETDISAYYTTSKLTMDCNSITMEAAYTLIKGIYEVGIETTQSNGDIWLKSTGAAGSDKTTRVFMDGESLILETDIGSGNASGTGASNTSITLDGKTISMTGAISLAGNLTGKYLTGTWLQTTAATDLGSAASKIAVLDGSGWVYYRTPTEILSDIGASASGHTHTYAGSSSAGGAATSANKVNKNLVIKLNSGTTEGTDLFTFNGSAAKTVNVTASSIGAAASSHKHYRIDDSSGTYYCYLATSGNFNRGASGQNLGASGTRWNCVYLTTAANVSSDRNLKEEFSTNFEKYIELFDLVTPTSFLRKDEEQSTRKRHTGYIAQDFESALRTVGLEEKEFAGFSKDIGEDGETYYGLCHEEFIPILHAKMNKDKQNAEASIKQLEARIEQLTILSQELLYQLASQQKILKTLAQ